MYASLYAKACSDTNYNARILINHRSDPRYVDQGTAAGLKCRGLVFAQGVKARLWHQVIIVMTGWLLNMTVTRIHCSQCLI